MKLSAIIIAKDAENIITDCLESVRFCDEIIIVDGGSRDKTNEIAKKYKARIIKGVYNDFAQQRNLGLAAANGEWVLYIDTDERVSDILQKQIERIIKEDNNSIVAYTVRRKNYYFGNNPWPYIETLERLFKKHTLKGWYGKLHESPRIDGNLSSLDGVLLHYTHRDLSSMLQKTLVWSQYEAELRMQANHPPVVWWRLLRVMWTGFSHSYFKQGGYKAGTVGMIESIYQAFSMFITYARLWEMQQAVKQ